MKGASAQTHRFDEWCASSYGRRDGEVVGVQHGSALSGSGGDLL